MLSNGKPIGLVQESSAPQKRKFEDCIPCRLVYDYGGFTFGFSREVSMQYVVGCLLFITGIVAYVPVVYIRKTNRIIKLLEQIEANTRKA